MFGNKTVAKQNCIRFPLMAFKYYLCRYNIFDQKMSYIYLLKFKSKGAIWCIYV